MEVLERQISLAFKRQTTCFYEVKKKEKKKKLLGKKLRTQDLCLTKIKTHGLPYCARESLEIIFFITKDINKIPRDYLGNILFIKT